MIIQAKTIKLDTRAQVQIFDLTEEVKQFLAESGVANGMGVVSTLHTTTGIFFTETQDALWDDVDAFLHHVVADKTGYKHNDPAFSDCERKNAAAHLRAIMLGGSLALQVDNGQLILGQFQRIIFAELDGPRPRSIRMQFMGIGDSPQINIGQDMQRDMQQDQQKSAAVSLQAMPALQVRASGGL